MIAGADRMGVKTGLSASLLLLASPVFFPISVRETVREQKNPCVSKCQLLLVASGIVL